MGELTAGPQGLARKSWRLAGGLIGGEKRGSESILTAVTGA